MAHHSTSASRTRPSAVAALWSAVQLPLRQAFAGGRADRGKDLGALSDHLRRDLGFEPVADAHFNGLSQLRG